MTDDRVANRSVQIIIKSASVPTVRRAVAPSMYATAAEVYGYYLVKAAGLIENDFPELPIHNRIARMLAVTYENNCKMPGNV